MAGRKELTIRFSGTAGEGVLTAGDILARALARAGYHLFYTVEYDAEVRGDKLSMSQLRISSNPLLSQGDRPDLLVAFSVEAAEAHLDSLSPDGVLIYDHKVIDAFGETTVREVEAGEGRQSIPIPFLELAWKRAGRAESKNMVALGAVAAMLGVSGAAITGAVLDRLGSEGHAAAANRKALALGIESAEHIDTGGRMAPGDGLRRLYLSGNQAVVLGALAAGCRFFAGYPITPASEIMEGLARVLPEVGGAVMQMEDEMAALGAVLGASFGGAKAMTATSGPGLSLMSELINLGAMAEVPAVIVNVQRGGPSTGLPTRPEQSDLNLAVYGVHGESPRIVFAPTSVEDCFYRTIEAFNLAERCQTPVILLPDQFLGQSKGTVRNLDPSRVPVEERKMPAPEDMEEYRRYRRTESGVSPMAVPGMGGGHYLATGLEHTDRGLPGYKPETHRKMHEKRFRKLELIRDNGFICDGDGGETCFIVGWGSTAGVLREAASGLKADGVPLGVLVVNRLNPWPTGLADILRGKTVYSVEMNFTGQFNSLLRQHGIVAVTMPWEGRIFSAAGIAEWVKMCIKGEGAP